MANRIILNNVSYHGAGAIKAIPEEVKGRGFKSFCMLRSRLSKIWKNSKSKHLY